MEVKIERWQRFYPGFITKVNNNGTSYCVQFDDGERIAAVKPHEMRKPEGTAGNAAADQGEFLVFKGNGGLLVGGARGKRGREQQLTSER